MTIYAVNDPQAAEHEEFNTLAEAIDYADYILQECSYSGIWSEDADQIYVYMKDVVSVARKTVLAIRDEDNIEEWTGGDCDEIWTYEMVPAESGKQ